MSDCLSGTQHSGWHINPTGMCPTIHAQYMFVGGVPAVYQEAMDVGVAVVWGPLQTWA